MKLFSDSGRAVGNMLLCVGRAVTRRSFVSIVLVSLAALSLGGYGPAELLAEGTNDSLSTLSKQ
jgi:hypothetical protein